MPMSYEPSQTFLSLPKKRRQTIIEYSLIEFATYSYKGASLNNMLEKAGIAKGSFYQYFRDKKHLYLYLVQSAMDKKIKKLTEALSEEKDLFAFLRAIKEEKFTLDPKQTAFMLKASVDHSIQEVQMIIKNTSVAFFKKIIQNNKAILNPKLKPEVIVFILTTLFNHFGQFLLTLENSSEREGAYTDFIEILETGIRR